MRPTDPLHATPPPAPARADDAAVRRAAAAWFARMADGEATDRDRACLDNWLREDPRHAYEYGALRAIWDAAGQMPSARLRALADAPLRPSPLSPARRRGLGLALASVVGGVSVLAWLGRREEVVTVATSLGERRQITLPDGSLADLDSGTRLEARFSQGRREIHLAGGEAVFDVRHDAARPFTVAAGLGTVTVTGTRFAVRRDVDRVRVVVITGAVRVAGHAAAHVVALAPGQAVSIDAQGTPGGVAAVDPQQALAWRAGQIVFRDTALADAAREVSRYRSAPIVLAGDAGLAGLRLTSVFRTDDPEVFLTALPHILPVRVRHQLDGVARIEARTGF